MLEGRYPNPNPNPDPNPDQVLSVCSVQYKAVLDAMRMRASAFKYEGVEYYLHEQGCAPSVTMNPHPDPNPDPRPHRNPNSHQVHAIRHDEP